MSRRGDRHELEQAEVDRRYSERGTLGRRWLESALEEHRGAFEVAMRSAVLAMLPGGRQAVEDRLVEERATLRLVAIVGPVHAERYVEEAMRRWEFANRLNVETTTGGRTKAAVLEAFVAEVQAGIV